MADTEGNKFVSQETLHTIEKLALVLALALIVIFRPEKLVTVEQTAQALGVPVAQVAPIVSAVLK